MLRLVAGSLLTGVLLLLAGCGGATAARHAPPPVNPGSDWEADVAGLHRTALFYARQIQDRFEAGDPQRVALEQKYNSAEVALNLWIQDVQDSVRAGRNAGASPLYRTRLQNATRAMEGYVAAADEALQLDATPKFLPVMTLAPTLVEFLWQRVREAGERRQQEGQQVRNEYAARLEKYKLPEFEKVR